MLRNLHFRNFIPNEKQIAFNRSLEITLCDLLGFNIVLVHNTILYEGLKQLASEGKTLICICNSSVESLKNIAMGFPLFLMAGDQFLLFSTNEIPFKSSKYGKSTIKEKCLKFQWLQMLVVFKIQIQSCVFFSKLVVKLVASLLR